MTKNGEFNSRWGNAIADDFQYCHVPGYILRNYAKCVSLLDVLNKAGEIDIKRGQIVDLNMQDMMFVIHVMAFKYDAPNGKATPGLPTIAEYSGIHVTGLRRIKKKLISYGLLTVQSEIGRPDTYTFSGLHDQCARVEQGLPQIEGVEITPSKSARASKSARGWASKSARGVVANPLVEESSKGNKKSSPRKRDEYFEAISETFGTSAGGWVGNLKNMMLGVAKSGEWAKCNFTPPVTDPAEIIAFKPYMDKRKREKKITGDITACVTIQRWFYDFRTENAKKLIKLDAPPIDLTQWETPDPFAFLESEGA